MRFTRTNAVSIRVVSVKDEVRSGRLVTDKISAIFEKVEYDIAEELDVDHKTVLRHLRKSGYKKNLTFGYHIISLRET